MEGGHRFTKTVPCSMTLFVRISADARRYGYGAMDNAASLENASHCRQRALDIGQKIVAMLKPDRQAQRAVSNTQFRACFL